jgi:hypothetical protein
MTYPTAACIQVGQKRTYVAPLVTALPDFASNLKMMVLNALSIRTASPVTPHCRKENRTEMEGRGSHKLGCIRELSWFFFRTPLTAQTPVHDLLPPHYNAY